MLSGVIWTKAMFGTDFYHLIASFVLYSIVGWFAESVYMSFCEKKITNRGFGRGPFCPIYGFGATIGCLILNPFSKSYFLVYVIGAVSATIFEYISAVLMIKLLGKLWWDYNDKPYNYNGIICLESTVGWGFYAIGVVMFLNPWLMRQIDSIDPMYVKRFIVGVMIIAVIDYIIRFAEIFAKDQVDRARTLVISKFRREK